MNLTLVIPAFNAAEALPELLERIGRTIPDAGIIVVDDGSSDGTSTAAQRFGVDVITHDHNRGKGEALRTGFAAARERDSDAVIQLDADLQHTPEEIPAFIDAFAAGRGEVLVGARDFRAAAMPIPRRISNTMTSWIVSRIAGQAVPDSQCGFRLIARPVLDVIAPRSGGFAFESEFLVLAARAGFRLGAVPIRTVYRHQPTFIHPWRDTARFVGVMTSLLLQRRPRRVPEGRPL
ncbi:MAG TPA: glycosyltransferase family 2 protein [Acidobacteriota bacterium]|nr:glycosyltransferase family 2 protein [Acidobacteriota bacterium]